MWPFKSKPRDEFVPLTSVAEAIRAEDRQGWVDGPRWPTAEERKARDEAEERRKRFELIRGTRRG